MGSMTRLEIQTEVLTNLDNRTDIADTLIQRWINHTYNHLTHPAIHIFEDLSTTYDVVLVNGTASYSLATAAVGYRVLAVRGASYYAAASGSIATTTRRYRLKPKPINWYDGTQHSAGNPRHYIIGEGQTIIFSSTPKNTNTIRLRLSREVDKLDDDSDTTVLPEYFDEVLVTGTQAFAEFKLGMRDRANETFQLYNSLINGGDEKDVMEGQNWDIETQLTSVPSMGVSI